MSIAKIGASPISILPRREPVCVTGSLPLIEAAERMSEKQRGAAAVVDEEGKLVGIVTIRDLIRGVDHSDHNWHGRAVSEVMTPGPTCVNEDDSLLTALQTMEKGNFRHLPRVDAKGRPTAILSVRDILAEVSQQFPKEFVNLPARPRRPSTVPWGG